MRRPRIKRWMVLLTVAFALFFVVAIILGGGDKAGGDVGRAVLIDTDFGTAGGVGPNADWIEHAAGDWYPSAAIFSGLLANDDYRRDFVTRLSDLLNTRFSLASASAKLADIRSRRSHARRMGVRPLGA